MSCLISNPLYSPDAEWNWLAGRAEDRQELARAPGTRAASRSTVSELLAFCHRYRADPMRMTEIHVCLWVEYLDNRGIAPATIKNKVSHARGYMRLAGADLSGFNHVRVTRALDAVSRRKDYVPGHKKDAIPAQALRAALRQSEVAPPSVKAFNPLVHLTRGDIHMDHQVTVQIKAGKNLQRYDQRKISTLFPTGDPVTCPMLALRAVFEWTPGLPSTAPGT